MNTIPPRFLAGSTEPAVAYTVEALRELLAELPPAMLIPEGASLLVQPCDAGPFLEIHMAKDGYEDALADPDGDYELDDLDTQHEADAEGDYDPDAADIAHETGGES